MKFGNLQYKFHRFLDMITKFNIDGNNVGEIYLFHSGSIVICILVRRQNRLEISDLTLTTSTSTNSSLSQTVSMSMDNQEKVKKTKP